MITSRGFRGDITGTCRNPFRSARNATADSRTTPGRPARRSPGTRTGGRQTGPCTPATGWPTVATQASAAARAGPGGRSRGVCAARSASSGVQVRAIQFSPIIVEIAGILTLCMRTLAKGTAGSIKKTGGSQARLRLRITPNSSARREIGFGPRVDPGTPQRKPGSRLRTLAAVASAAVNGEWSSRVATLGDGHDVVCGEVGTGVRVAAVAGAPVAV